MCDRYIMYIIHLNNNNNNNKLHLYRAFSKGYKAQKPISRSSQVYFCFYKQNIVFEANVMFDGQKWEFVSVKKCNISNSACLIS